MLNKIPRRPKDSITELDDKIRNLEHQRTTTSISLQQEKEILRQINGIKKSKLTVNEYHAMEKQVQDTKVRQKKSLSGSLFILLIRGHHLCLFHSSYMIITTFFHSFFLVFVHFFLLLSKSI